VLLVGASEGLASALEPPMTRRRVYIEQCDTHDATDAVVAAAPDLVVLCGDAAGDAGQHILKALSSSPQTSVVPVAILDDNAELETRLRAFRHGAAAVIPRSASMDAIAERIATLAREIPERDSESLGDVGEATLEELVSALGKELRSGILSVRAADGSESDAIRLVLSGGRTLSDTIDEFVQSVREHVVTAEPLKYEFDERAGGTISLVGADDLVPPEMRADMSGLRIILADDDTARADAVTRELRAHDVEVVVTDLNPTDVRFHRLRGVDAAILLIGEQQAKGPGYELMRRMRRDTRLRWASLLVIRWEEVFTEQDAVPAVDRILGTLAALAEPEHALHERATAGVPFDTRLEITGPARLVRALVDSGKPLRLSLQNPRVRVTLDVSDGLVVGAMGETVGMDHRELSGPEALAAMMVVSSGRVHIHPTEHPAVTNIMATSDVALNMADAEPPPILPSMPVAAPAEARPVESHETRPKQKGGFLGTIAFGAAGLIGVLVLGGLILWITGFGVTVERTQSVSAAVKSAEGVPTSNIKGATVAAETARPATTKKKTEAPPVPPGSVSVVELNALTDAPTCESLLGPRKPNPGVYPGAAYDQLRAARRALVRGDLDAVQREYCMGLRFDPSNGDILVGLARLMLSRRDPKQAVQYARDAVKSAPDEKSRQLLLGDALALTDPSKAAEPILLGSGVAVEEPTSRKTLAIAQSKAAEDALKKQDLSYAERAFRRAAILDPSNALAASGVARALLDQGFAPAAAHWARRATNADAKSIPAHIALGDALQKAGDREGAITAWKRAAELDPNDPSARSRLLGL
jgi:DNA-binding NarL/FixJ family response regulator